MSDFNFDRKSIIKQAEKILQECNKKYTDFDCENKSIIETRNKVKVLNIKIKKLKRKNRALKILTYCLIATMLVIIF